MKRKLMILIMVIGIIVSAGVSVQAKDRNDQADELEYYDELLSDWIGNYVDIRLQAEPNLHTEALIYNSVILVGVSRDAIMIEHNGGYIVIFKRRIILIRWSGRR